MIVTAMAEHALILGVLTAYGAGPDAAQLQARWLVEADLRGLGSHGLQRLPMLVARIERGVIVPDADPVLSWRSASALAVDGRRGFGPVTGMHAVQQCVDRAGQAGIVLAAVHNANHLGILAPYVEAVADRGMIGIAMTTSEGLQQGRRIPGCRPVGAVGLTAGRGLGLPGRRTGHAGPSRCDGGPGARRPGPGRAQPPTAGRGGDPGPGLARGARAGAAPGRGRRSRSARCNPIPAQRVKGILRTEARRNGIHGDGTKTAGSTLARTRVPD
jgi:Malate/L-lactate dehydrogenase